MPAFAQDLAKTRQVRLRQTDQADALGLEMHGCEDGDIVKHRRHDREGGNGEIAGAQELRHHEGGGTHDRRHELAAGGGHGLDRAGEGGPVAGALHQRDGEGTGGHDVGHGAARDSAEQAAGDDRHLGGAARGMAC